MRMRYPSSLYALVAVGAVLLAPACSSEPGGPGGTTGTLSVAVTTTGAGFPASHQVALDQQEIRTLGSNGSTSGVHPRRRRSG